MAGTTIFLTGARGKTGAAVAAWLAGHRRVEVRGGTSRPSLAAAPGTKLVPFDWAQPGSWDSAVEGADAVYLMRPGLEDAPELVARLVATTRPDARIVLLSEMGAERLPQGDWVVEVERAVMAGDRPWTILRPGWFQQVLTDDRFFRADIVDRGVVAMPTGGAAFSWIDVRDIAAVAGHALTREGHAGATYTLSGPAARTLAEVTQRLSAVTGRPVRPLDPAPEDAVAGLDPWLTDVLGAAYERGRAGVFGQVTDDVHAVTGRSARSIESFIAEHASAWRPAR
jgi:uncharacterized protein YbjT (DUF2867 family)